MGKADIRPDDPGLRVIRMGYRLRGTKPDRLSWAIIFSHDRAPLAVPWIATIGFDSSGGTAIQPFRDS